jgi:energy-converting hydrogenase B subunit F
MTFMKAFHAVYMRPKPADLEIKNEKIPRTTILSLLVFLAVCLIFGLFPQLATGFLQAISSNLAGGMP